MPRARRQPGRRGPASRRPRSPTGSRPRGSRYPRWAPAYHVRWWPCRSRIPFCASSVRNVYIGWLKARSTITCSGRICSPGFSETQYWIGPGRDCSRFMWYVIVRASPGRRQSLVCTFHEARACGLAGRMLSSVCRTTWFSEYSNPPRTSRSVPSASASRRRASSACVAITTASKRSARPLAVRTVTPFGSRRTLVTGSPVRTDPGGRAATTRATYSFDPPRITRHCGALP